MGGGQSAGEAPCGIGGLGDEEMSVSAMAHAASVCSPKARTTLPRRCDVRVAMRWGQKKTRPSGGCDRPGFTNRVTTKRIRLDGDGFNGLEAFLADGRTAADQGKRDPAAI